MNDEGGILDFGIDWDDVAEAFIGCLAAGILLLAVLSLFDRRGSRT
jgi:hypothetical protein